ncbi:MAG: putative C4-dicarboxylate-binding periplasmic protein [Hyphomicrobiales bacterium]|nr:putative C4-dicarboxylate-binding periplasmic protein [Hyphomicrobiales bacterium]
MAQARSFLAGSLAAAAFLAACGAATAQTIELKVSHYLPPNHTFQKELVKWGDDLAKQSGGRLKLNIFPASQLGPVNRQFDLARNGVADIAVGLHGVTPGRYPTTELVSLPYQSPSSGGNSAVTSKRLSELAPEFLAQEHPGMKILWMAVTNPLMFHTANKQIKSVQDFKGLRIRYAGEQFAQIITALGASPLAVPPAETQDGLSKGIVDGATFPYEATMSFDLGTVVKHSLEPGISTATFAVVMNPAKFNSLPDDLKVLIEKTTGPDMAARFGAAFDESEKHGRDYMVSKNVQISTLAPAELTAMKALMQPIVDRALANAEKQGKPGRKFLDAYTR